MIGGDGRGFGDGRLYGKPVPYPVLLTVDRIRSQFPTAQFRVSDDAPLQGDVVKDPFLMVSYGGSSYIVEKWDEPGFGG